MRLRSAAAVVLLALTGAAAVGLTAQRSVDEGTAITTPPAPPPAALARTLRGLSPDRQLTCIRLIDAIEPSGAGDTILWRAGRRIYYRNDTAGGCNGLARGDRIVTERLGSDRLCEGDIVRTQDRTSGALTGTCTLGGFVRYVPPNRR